MHGNGSRAIADGLLRDEISPRLIRTFGYGEVKLKNMGFTSKEIAIAMAELRTPGEKKLQGGLRLLVRNHTINEKTANLMGKVRDGKGLDAYEVKDLTEAFTALARFAGLVPKERFTKEFFKIKDKFFHKYMENIIKQVRR